MAWATGVAVALAAALTFFFAAAPALAQGPTCQFVLGFKALHDLDPADVGDCVDNQGYAANGDAVQHTTKGLLAWRKADNTAAFTNGTWTWVLGPQGLQKRPNGQRFPWEANPQGLPLVPPPDLPAADLGGKAIVVHLAAQSLTAYDHGKVALSTPVTTGRPYLATLEGESTIFRRESPYLFISPWPEGSPYWYPPSWVTWALEFRTGGYFLHDAPWEPDGAYGPGSQDGPYASHGCVHVPHAAMQFLWTWASNGTPVIVEQ